MKRYSVYFRDNQLVCGTDRHTWCNYSSLTNARAACKQLVTTGAKSLANNSIYKSYEAELVDNTTGDVLQIFKREV